jgi:hypothetical protein
VYARTVIDIAHVAISLLYSLIGKVKIRNSTHISPFLKHSPLNKVWKMSIQARFLFDSIEVSPKIFQLKIRRLRLGTRQGELKVGGEMEMEGLWGKRTS